MRLPRIGLKSLVGITAQLVLLLGLVCWAIRSEALYCRPEVLTITINDRVVTLAELADADNRPMGPAPGWELYDVPIEVFAPVLWFALLLLAAAYVGLIVYAVWRKRRFAAAWWLSPVTLATVTFFVLAFLTKPRIFY
ncbi:MAG: hypothetical protein NTW96_18795 [Planctomycetia bacterium]|nr:hypothetical protein [Planctomycetia bacterium]